MKKTFAVIMSLIFSAGTLFAADPFRMSNPYQMTEGRSMEDLAAFATPARMFDVSNIKYRPVAATDINGNKCYYTTSGRLALSISKSGQMTFSLGGVSITKANDRSLVSVSKSIRGTNTIEISNDKGEIIGYQKTGYGGKVVKQLDSAGNTTQTIESNKFGKVTTAVINNMTNGKTIYNAQGQPTYELDFEGNRMVSYIYDDNNKLTEKIDVYGNRTHYDDSGNMTFTENKDGVVLMKWNYKYDANGRYVLDNSFDPTTNETTRYDGNGRQMYTENYAGAKIVDYVFNGASLVATFDRQNNLTTWYDKSGKTIGTTFNDEWISKNIYASDGQLVGTFDYRSNQVTIFQNERREIVLQLGIDDEGQPHDKIQPPTAEQIKQWIDDGLIKDAHLLVNPL